MPSAGMFIPDAATICELPHLDRRAHPQSSICGRGLYTPGVLVLEKQPRWESELKRQFLGSGIPVRACRSTSRLSSLVETMPGSVLLMDLEAGAGECLRLIAHMHERAVLVQMIAIGSAGAMELEWVARELGAVHFEPDSIRGEELARFCRRQLEHLLPPRAAEDQLQGRLLS